MPTSMHSRKVWPLPSSDNFWNKAEKIMSWCNEQVVFSLNLLGLAGQLCPGPHCVLGGRDPVAKRQGPLRLR